MKVSKEFINGFIEGFLSSCEGCNGEYGNIDSFHWNVPNKEETQQLRDKLREQLKMEQEKLE